MTTPAPAPLSPDAVLELARLEGYSHLDPDTAARIATGAANAVHAVVGSVRESLFEFEPADYLVELERLADAGAGGSGA